MKVADIDHFLAHSELATEQGVQVRFLAEIALQLAIMNERNAEMDKFNREQAALDERDRETDAQRRAQGLQQMNRMIEAQEQIVSTIAPPPPFVPLKKEPKQ